MKREYTISFLYYIYILQIGTCFIFLEIYILII
jgi:hypothetical protein